MSPAERERFAVAAGKGRERVVLTCRGVVDLAVARGAHLPGTTEHVTFVAHSFGTLLAENYDARYPARARARCRSGGAASKDWIRRR